MYSLLSLVSHDAQGELFTSLFLLPNQIISAEDRLVIDLANQKELSTFTKPLEHKVFTLDGAKVLDDQVIDALVKVLSALSGGKHSVYTQADFSTKQWGKYLWIPFDHPIINLQISNMYSLICNGYIPFIGSIYELE